MCLRLHKRLASSVPVPPDDTSAVSSLHACRSPFSLCIPAHVDGEGEGEGEARSRQASQHDLLVWSSTNMGCYRAHAVGMYRLQYFTLLNPHTTTGATAS